MEEFYSLYNINSAWKYKVVNRTVKLGVTAISDRYHVTAIIGSSCFKSFWYLEFWKYPGTSKNTFKNTCDKLWISELSNFPNIFLWLVFYEKSWILFKTENEWADSDQWSKDNCKEHFGLSTKLRVRLSTSLQVPNSSFSGRRTKI